MNREQNNREPNNDKKENMTCSALRDFYNTKMKSFKIEVKKNPLLIYDYGRAN